MMKKLKDTVLPMIKQANTLSSMHTLNLRNKKLETSSG